MMRICCVCHRVERNGRWESAFSLPENELVTHGYCPACFVEAMAEVEELTGFVAGQETTAPGRSIMRGQWG